MENQEIVVRQPDDIILATPPDVVLNNAKIAAKALADVISHKKKPVIMNGEQYLEYEDLQTLGQFYGYAVRTGDTMPIEIDGTKGAKALASLIELRTGHVVGGAESYCMRDEDKWKNKPWFQLASMAQTRAGAKALRNRLAWVVVLAGYRPTPAEEMTENEHQTMPIEHICPIHNVPFFKRGKMKGYAHPIGDTGEWCNEETPQEAESPTQEAKVPQSTSGTSETKPLNQLPASQKEVFDKLMALVKSNALTQVDATATVVTLGGAGENILQKIKSLKPEKLQELNKKLDGLKSPFPDEEPS